MNNLGNAIYIRLTDASIYESYYYSQYFFFCYIFNNTTLADKVYRPEEHSAREQTLCNTPKSKTLESV